MQAHNPLRQKEKAVMERLGIKSKKRLRRLYKKQRRMKREEEFKKQLGG